MTFACGCVTRVVLEGPAGSQVVVLRLSAGHQGPCDVVRTLIHEGQRRGQGMNLEHLVRQAQ